MRVGVLLFREVLPSLVLPLYRAGNVEAGITNALQFADLAKHRTDLALRLIRQVGIAHLLQIGGNLNLHVVGNVLILLDALKLMLKVLLVLLVEQVPHHAEHPLHPLGKVRDFLLRLQHRDFRRLHHASLQKLQVNDVVSLALALLRTDDKADDALDLGHKPDEDERVDQIETRVECRQHNAQFGSVGKESRMTPPPPASSSRHSPQNRTPCR